MTLDDVDGSEVRAMLRRLGLTHMEGSANHKGEFWIAKSGHPYFLPYGTQPPNSFVKQAVDEIVDSLT